MADDVTLNAGAGGDTLAADDIAGVKFQRVKLVLGANNTNDGDVASGNPLPISDAAGSLTVDGSVTVTQGTGSNLHTVIDSGTVSTITNVVHVDDNAGNLSIDDGGNSITVDGTVGVSGTVTVDSELTTADLDTGAGTDTRAVVGVVVAASGGAVALSGNSGNKDGGTVRVVLATDQPALTNKLLVTPDSVALPANQSVNVAQLAATTTDTNSGSKSAGTLRVVIATDQPALTNKLLVTPDAVTHDVGTITTAVVPGTGATNLGKAEDAAHNTGDVGVMALAVRASSPTERSAGPTDGDYEPLGVNEVGALWGTLTPSANGGLTTFMASGSDGSSILVATSQVIKASAGVLYGYYAYNPEAAVTFVHFYNTASASVTVGTTNPLFTIAIPAGSAANLALPYGITFSNAGWSCAATTTAGGNTAPATGVSLVAWYK
jgi:hypothetical protein